jgi:hypothetical protein
MGVLKYENFLSLEIKNKKATIPGTLLILMNPAKLQPSSSSNAFLALSISIFNY